MKAVLKSGGKEYQVSEGDLIRVEKLEGKTGDRVLLKDVLMLSDPEQVRIGTPYVSNVEVTCEIVQQVKGKKVLTYKMKRRKNYRRLKGHRQNYTYLRVGQISVTA